MVSLILRAIKIMVPSPVSLLDCMFLKAAAKDLEPDLLQDLESLYAFYHRQWWCYGQRYFQFKWFHTLLNALALSITVAGMVVGSMMKDSLWVTSLSALGVVVKGWNDFKMFAIKVDMSFCFYHVRQDADRTEKLHARSSF